MLRHLRRIHVSRASFQEVKVSAQETDNVSNVPLRDTTYRVHAAGILTRNPIILRQQSEFESAYEQYRQDLQAETSRGIFNIMTAHKRELAQLQGDTEKETNIPSFPLAEEYLRADTILNSIKRKLDRKLYFVVRNESAWQFPSILISYADMPLHKHVRRMWGRLLGKECEIYQMGRAPVAYHRERMPDRVSAPMGVKTFFFRSQLVSGTMVFSRGHIAQEYAWLTKEELQEVLPADYYNSIKPVLSY